MKTICHTFSSFPFSKRFITRGGKTKDKEKHTKLMMNNKKSMSGKFEISYSFCKFSFRKNDN